MERLEQPQRVTGRLGAGEEERPAGVEVVGHRVDRHAARPTDDLGAGADGEPREIARRGIPEAPVGERVPLSEVLADLDDPVIGARPRAVALRAPEADQGIVAGVAGDVRFPGRVRDPLAARHPVGRGLTLVVRHGLAHGAPDDPATATASLPVHEARPVAPQPLLLVMQHDDAIVPEPFQHGVRDVRLRDRQVVVGADGIHGGLEVGMLRRGWQRRPELAVRVERVDVAADRPGVVSEGREQLELLVFLDCVAEHEQNGFHGLHPSSGRVRGGARGRPAYGQRRFAVKPPGPSSGPVKVTAWVGSSNARRRTCEPMAPSGRWVG